MLYIAVCDDELKIGAELERILIDILGKLNIKYEIDVFFGGEELQNRMEAGAHYDLIFLDIEFAQGQVNGVDVGRIIRDTHHNYLASIVYISWERNYALQLFDVQPLNFLIKPLTYEMIDDVIKKYLKLAGLWLGAFTYRVGHDSFKVQIKDIVYLESANKKLILHLVGGRQEEFYGSIKEAYEGQLRKFDFLFIHAAYVVNFDYVTAMKFNQVYVAGSDAPLPISKHRRNEVKETYYAILNRWAGG